MIRLVAILAYILGHLICSSAMAEDPDRESVPLACRSFFDPGGTLNYAGAREKLSLCLEVISDLKAEDVKPLFMKLKEHFPACEVGRGWFILYKHKEIFAITPPLQTTIHELAAIAEFEMACRIDNRDHVDVGFDAIRSQDPSEEISDVVQYFEPDLEKQRSIDAKVEADAARQQAQMLAKAAEQRALAVSGFTRSTVVDIETDGRDGIGRKVIVNGWLMIVNQDIAEIASQHDDLQGVLVDLRDAPHSLRKDIFQRCSSNHDRCPVTIKATIVSNEDGTGVHLQAE